jgi:response regulator RpfG family c-di-GMP phosphodiesterase
MAIKEILLVDNKTPIISAIGFILQDQGHLVMVAPDPETASVELDNYNFDLMFVYLSGPEQDKFSLLSQAKRRSPRTHIMVAGNPRKYPLPIESFQTEVDEYLLAPFSPPELCQRVDKCLRTNHVETRELRAEEINRRILNSLRFTFRDLHNSFVSMLSGLSLVKNNLVVQDGHDMLSLLADFSRDLSRCMNISEEFLSKTLLSTNTDGLKNSDKFHQ